MNAYNKRNYGNYSSSDTRSCLIDTIEDLVAEGEKATGKKMYYLQ